MEGLLDGVRSERIGAFGGIGRSGRGLTCCESSVPAVLVRGSRECRKVRIFRVSCEVRRVKEPFVLIWELMVARSTPLPPRLN